jgi:hypothetical protein
MEVAQKWVDGWVLWVEELVGAHSKPAVHSLESYTVWLHKVAEQTWVEHPQNLYNLAGLVLALGVIFVGLKASAHHLHHIEPQIARLKALVSKKAEVKTSEPEKPAVAAKAAPAAKSSKKRAPSSKKAVAVPASLRARSTSVKPVATRSSAKKAKK